MATSTEEPETGNSRGPAVLDMKTIVLENLRRRELTWRPYGNYHVLCGGCILVGPVRSWWWLLEIFIIIITITFVIEYENYNLWVWISGLVIFVIVFASSWKTLLGDPGILKKPTFAEAMENAKYASANLEPRPFGGGGVYTYKVIQNGDSVRHSYCFRCHNWRPPLTGHCAICGCCQLKWDHHCPVYGGCVAQKNIVAFHIMTISIPIYVTYLLVVSCFAAAHSLKDARAANIFRASIVADEILIGIVLALIVPSLLALLPCEQEKRDPPPDNQPPKATMMQLLTEASRTNMYATRLGPQHYRTTDESESY